MDYQGSYELLTTSHLFLASSCIGYYMENYEISLGIFIVYLTSIMYHYPKEMDNQIFRKMDITSNFILGFYFCYQLFKMKIYLPVICAFIIVSIYIIFASYCKEDMEMMANSKVTNHIIFIHIPVYLTFSYIHFCLYCKKYMIQL